MSDNQTFDVYKQCVIQSIKNTTFIDRMKDYCDFKDANTLGSRVMAGKMAQKHPELPIYYNTLGAAKIRALSYQESKLKEEYSFVVKSANIEHKVNQAFTSGSRIPKTQIKARLQIIYDELGLKKKAKTTDIANFGFTIKDVKIPTNDGRVCGFEIKKIA